MNDVLSAFFIEACARLNRDEGTIEMYATVNVTNYRERVPFIPQRYIGNASYMIATPLLSADTPIGIRAGAIHNAIAPMVGAGSKKLEELIHTAAEVSARKIPLMPFEFFKAFNEKPTMLYINNFSRLPIYHPDFGTGIPYSAIPHELGDPVHIWPAPPEKGCVEVYFTGAFARRIKQLGADDPWFRSMEWGGMGS